MSTFCIVQECLATSMQLCLYLVAEWGPWTPWSDCSVSCGGGVQRKTRECSKPGSVASGCKGRVFIDQKCNTQNCSGMQLYFFMLSVLDKRNTYGRARKKWTRRNVTLTPWL